MRTATHIVWALHETIGDRNAPLPVMPTSMAISIIQLCAHAIKVQLDRPIFTDQALGGRQEKNPYSAESTMSAMNRTARYGLENLKRTQDELSEGRATTHAESATMRAPDAIAVQR